MLDNELETFLLRRLVAVVVLDLVTVARLVEDFVVAGVEPAAELEVIEEFVVTGVEPAAGFVELELELLLRLRDQNAELGVELIPRLLAVCLRYLFQYLILMLDRSLLLARWLLLYFQRQLVNLLLAFLAEMVLPVDFVLRIV